jgi:predicted transposase YdaD
MPQIDLPVKRLVQRRSGDWVKYLKPECREEWIRPFKSEYTPKVESRLDNVFEVDGLYPLLPLMKSEAGEDAKQVLQQSIEVVSKIEDKALRQDLLAVMGILAGGKYAAELVYSMIRREMVMQSPIYQEWVKEERAEAEEKGRVETKQEVICKFLARRFGIDSAETQEKVQQLTNLEILDNVLTELFVANSLEEAQNIIKEGINKYLQ